MRRYLLLSLVLPGMVFLLSCSDMNETTASHEADENTLEVAAPPSGPLVVEVIRVDGGYQLLRDGKPYEIRGAGIDRPKGVDPEGADLAQFAAHGGNSFRNWRDQSETDGLAILDEAAKHGLTVAMSIPIGRQRHGFDYDDEDAVAAQFEYARQEVLRYRDHPALLVWVIGNEINLQTTNLKTYDAVNDIARMIHELDPHHPVTTTFAGLGRDTVEMIETRMPELDIVSVQLYGDLLNLPQRLSETGLELPVLVTEWGTMGHWEVDQTAWGAPIELNSSEKARFFLESYQRGIASIPEQVIGNYVFVWGQKQERTPTWYGMFLEDGSETEVIDVMHRIWRDEWPENRAPAVEGLTLDGQTADDSVTLEPGEPYAAMVSVSDPDMDELSFRWEIMRESEATQVGGDKEDVPDTISGRIQGGGRPSVIVRAPRESGAYRLFVYVYDGQGNAGHANIPFLVESA